METKPVEIEQAHREATMEAWAREMTTAAPPMPPPLVTLRGQGPAPAGYVRCYSPTCPARRQPWNGRFAKLGTHYHPKGKA